MEKVGQISFESQTEREGLLKIAQGMMVDPMMAQQAGMALPTDPSMVNMAPPEMAQAAAFRDPRFRAVTEDELPYLDIEISVLTPLRQIESPEEVQVGLHGIMIRKGFLSGLLLPQVATERNWDRTTFLQETCRKAGLSPDAWMDDDAEIYVFSADVF